MVLEASLRQSWDELEAQPDGDGITVRRVNPTALGELFIGVERPGLTRLLVIELPRDALDHHHTHLSCTGFSVEAAAIAEKPTRARLVVRLRSQGYREIFTSLAADVFGSMPTNAEPAVLYRHMIRRLGNWRQFLSIRGSEGLSRLEQQGLYGELSFLLRRAIPIVGPTAVASWCGPQGRPQDFQFPTCAVEIKTMSGLSNEVAVANIQQLDPPTGVRLLLVTMTLEARTAGGESLPTLVSRVRDAAAEYAAQLDDRLLEAGYCDADQNLYVHTSYVERQHAVFDVVEGFPRLTQVLLPMGVGTVSYRIAIGACQPFRLSDDVVNRAIGAEV